MGASVKIMLSYDYSHFEVCKSTDKEGVTNKEINEMRKDVQRLADEAVRQYKKAKEMLQLQQGEIEEKENRIKKILRKPEGERTANEIAELKIYQDKEWNSQFDYDYDDDEGFMDENEDLNNLSNQSTTE